MALVTEIQLGILRDELDVPQKMRAKASPPAARPWLFFFSLALLLLLLLGSSPSSSPWLFFSFSFSFALAPLLLLGSSSSPFFLFCVGRSPRAVERVAPSVPYLLPLAQSEPPPPGNAAPQG